MKIGLITTINYLTGTNEILQRNVLAIRTIAKLLASPQCGKLTDKGKQLLADISKAAGEIFEQISSEGGR